ncbi:TetR/AcrR family transcriptional regulator [Nocardia sp. CNY236]|uniref:TetR/AcrR family transcriptional regulator n=1 Tax=Nocardia sp. CNY236 TaxID=1169152 RepID=UPI00048AAFB0|nr:TetR/AcrR family transcriptional regulator [Nocardia sp. CNY236]
MTTPARRRGRPPSAESSARDTKERIVRAAIELFAEQGFHATSVAEIGARADVQRGALYYHIGSKEELLWQILRDYTQVMLVDAERIANGHEDPITMLDELIHSHIRLIVRHRREVAVQLRDLGALTGTRAAELQDLRDRIQHCWQRVIDAGYTEKKLHTNDHVVANSVLGMLNMVALWYRPHGDHSPDEIAGIVATTLLDGVATDSARNTKG